MAGITTRPIPLNEPRLITPRSKSSLLVEVKALVQRDFRVPRGCLTDVATAVARALADRRTTPGRAPEYSLHCHYEDILRVVRARLIQIEKAEAARRARAAKWQERQARSGGEADIDDGWPRPPRVQGARRALAMQTRGAITRMRAIPESDTDGGREAEIRWLDNQTDMHVLGSLEAWSDTGVEGTKESWLFGFTDQTEGLSAMRVALADLRRAEHAALVARARLAGASLAYGLLTGSRAAGAKALGLSTAKLNTMTDPESSYARRKRRAAE